VCTENSVRIDLATESPNVIGDGRVVLLLAGAVRLAVQVEEPTTRDLAHYLGHRNLQSTARYTALARFAKFWQG